jgi:hypothetical protein
MPDELKLQGWIPELTGPDAIRDALEKAFDYRGDITIGLRDGSVVEGFVFDRRSNGPGLEDCIVRVIARKDGSRLVVRYSDVARVEFSGRDAADGKSFQLWVERYKERKARGENNISLAPDPLEDPCDPT